MTNMSHASNLPAEFMQLGQKSYRSCQLILCLWSLVCVCVCVLCVCVCTYLHTYSGGRGLVLLPGLLCLTGEGGYSTGVGSLQALYLTLELATALLHLLPKGGEMSLFFLFLALSILCGVPASPVLIPSTNRLSLLPTIDAGDEH